MELKYDDNKRRFFCTSSYSERLVPKQADFWWDADNKHWYTYDADRAYKLYNYADISTKERLDTFYKSIEMSKATSVTTDYIKPANLEYFPFQKAGIAFGIAKPNVLLADSMRLGKTIQALGVINNVDDVKKVLIICPATIKLNWRNEANRWLVSPRSIGIATGKEFPMENDIVIINYDIVQKHKEIINSIEWDMLICDEVHKLKNWKTIRTQNIVGKLNKETYAWDIEPIKAKRKLYLTGTPIVNRPKELWTLVNSLDSDTWKSFYYFSKRYCAGFQDRFGYHYDGASNLEELQTKLRASIMIRRTFEEVFPEMPAKQRQVIEIPADKVTSKAIAKEQEAVSAKLERMAELKAAVELAKVSDDPQDHTNAVKNLQDGVALSFEEISAVRKETAVAKAPLVVDYINEILEDSEDGYKLVIFAHHKEVVRILQDAFGDSCAVVTGDTPMAKRQQEIERFQNEPSCNKFIGTIGAAGVGINLAVSSHVLMVELDWVPGNVSQAEDRVRHVTKMTPVLIQHLVLEGSIDSTMAKLLIDKQYIIDKGLDENIEIVKTPIIPVAEGVSITKKELEEEVVKITDKQLKAAHISIRLLAGYCDGAKELDGMGFNKIDAEIGKKLSLLGLLTPKQGVLAMKIVRKYKKQVPSDLYEVMFGTEIVSY